MKSPDDLASERAWSRYWQSGALHSCATSYQANYGGAIEAYWNSIFDGLRPGDRALDAAAGNGALARLLVAHCADGSITCDAVDRARLAPAWGQDGQVGSDRIRFHPQTSLEALPFQDGSFALVVAQYGVEYTDLDRSLPELLRVTRRGGQIALLVHHAGSRPVELAREEITHLAWLLQPRGFVDLSRDLLEPLTLAQTPQGRAQLAGSPDADRLRVDFNDMQGAMTARATGSRCPDVLHEVREAVGRVFHELPSLGPAAARTRLDALRADLEDGAARLTDLLACALDEVQVSRLGTMLSPQCEIGVLREGQALMGWTVRARIGSAA